MRQVTILEGCEDDEITTNVNKALQHVTSMGWQIVSLTITPPTFHVKYRTYTHVVIIYDTDNTPQRPRTWRT